MVFPFRNNYNYLNRKHLQMSAKSTCTPYHRIITTSNDKLPQAQTSQNQAPNIVPSLIVHHPIANRS